MTRSVPLMPAGVASMSTVNGMNALALAKQLAPIMLWRVPGSPPPAPAALAPPHAAASPSALAGSLTRASANIQVRHHPTWAWH